MTDIRQVISYVDVDDTLVRSTIDMCSARRRLLNVLGGLAIASASCTSRDQELAGRISIAAQSSHGGEVNIRKLTTFDWERLFVFPPYTSSFQVQKELGFSWAESRRIEMQEGFVLLVFVGHGRVVRFVDQPRGGGDFSSCYRPGGFLRMEAVFRFTKDPGGSLRCAPTVG
jgi:hypothetical protein